MSNAFLDNNDSFLNPTDFTDEVKRVTGKNLYELMAEAIGVERQNMLSTGNSREYFKILVPVFSKYAVPAPTKSEVSSPFEGKSKEDIEGMYQNLLTRAQLSHKALDTAVDSPNITQSSTE